MSSMFPSAPSAPSMSFGPQSSLLLSAPPPEAHPQSLGTTISNETNTLGYFQKAPSHPPYDQRDLHAPSLPQHGFTPQYQEHVPQHSNDVPPVAMVSPEVDHNRSVEDSRPYNTVQKPEARINRGQSKQVTPAESPEGKTASNGRRRTRTKVVAWDPRDLEDIYTRKEVNKEEWDTICRRVGKGSTYSDSPQPASNGIKWASVNGYQSSPTEADSYYQRQSVDGGESSEDFELSSAPDSDHEGKSSKHFDLPARSTPSHPPSVAMLEQPHQQPVVPSMPMPMPLTASDGLQANGQPQPEFDVFAAQSRGQPIAPRQLPPKPPSTSTMVFDHRSSIAPDLRPAQKTKRGREFETVDAEFRNANNFTKRRKHQIEATDPPNTMIGVSEDYGLPFNPPHTVPNPPARILTDSELDDLCIRFRDAFRLMGAYYSEEQRINKELFDAAINRANARAATALQKLDEAHQSFADQAKEVRLSSQVEHDSLNKKLAAEISENRRLAEELAICRQRLAALDEASKRESHIAVADTIPRPDVAINAAPQPSLIETLQEELRTVKEDAKRADAANNLLDEEAAKMRSDGRGTQSMVQEVKNQHDRVTAKIDHLVSQDLQDLTNKEVKKFIMDVKAEDQGLSAKVRQVEDFLSKPNHLTFGAMHQRPNHIANGSMSGGPT
ncbi:MAG: hypothetical protein Q9198_001649 [Flavoplaca austrocitrina]